MSSKQMDAVILAAGRGSRMSQEIPKAYLLINERPLLSYSIERFAQSSFIENLIVVINRDDEDLFEQVVRKTCASTKKLRVVYGGDQRQDSALAGVRECSSEYVCVHDAARPLFSQNLLDALFDAVQQSSAVIPTVESADTLRFVSAESEILEDCDRSKIHQVQTPQCFERELLLSALKESTWRGEYFTDDAAAFKAIHNLSVKSIPGERTNLKITTDDDLKLAEAILKIH